MLQKSNGKVVFKRPFECMIARTNSGSIEGFPMQLSLVESKFVGGRSREKKFV